MRTWIEGGDCNYLEHGGLWYRNLKGTRRWHFIRLDNMTDCGDVLEYKYSADLNEVDLDALTKGQRAILEEELQGFPGEIEDALIADIAFSKSYRAPLHNNTGNNGHKLIREMKRLSRELEKDSDALQERMKRTVNALGMTAKEFQRDDMIPALQRGVSAGKESVKLMARIYRDCGGKTIGRERVPIEQIDGIWEL